MAPRAAVADSSHEPRALPLAGPSRLAQVLAARSFALTAEITPPKGSDARAVRLKAEHVAGCADAVNITDNQTARVHMSSLATAFLLKQAGIEPTLQVTTRDRNRLALQADLLGASALGVHNILALGGDPIHIGNDPTAKAVHDVDATGLIALARQLRDEGKDAGGADLNPRPDLFIGGTLNPFGGSTDIALKLLEDKIAAGADFFQTQAVFDVDAFASFLDLVHERGINGNAPILAGIIPLKSPRTAHYLAEKVPGIVIPARILDEIDRASDPAEYGRHLAADQVRQLRRLKGVAGVHIMAVNWEEALRPIAQEAGLLPRPQAL